jgi:uncharacterized protein with PIN domain
MEKIFIADAMLGKLAKWMRIIGCDVEYFPIISDNEISERANNSGRIILTRDTMLIRKKLNRENSFFVKSDHYKDQLRQVVKAFSIDPMKNLFTRCILCNKKLITIDKISVSDSVPEYVYYTQDKFKTCPSCKRLYWNATHKNNMIEQLKNILELR